MSGSNPRRKKSGCLGCLSSVIIFAAVIALTVVSLSGYLSLQDSCNLTLSKAQAVASQTIGASGGAIKIAGDAGGISGMTITVPEGAYDKTVNFKISTSSITGDAFRNTFDPITPLIKIDNGGAFASKPLTVTIPISVGNNEFAMGFYYDRKTGKLEGMPLISLSNTEIKVGATHFSEFLITKILKSKLDDITVKTGYSPGRDDWQFVNYGSVIAQNGHCAGQSMSSMWYYYEKGLSTGQRLHGKFDNNSSVNKTPLFQYDDSFGYRFASVIHKASDWDSVSYKLFDSLMSKSDRLEYYAFAYSMNETNMPQLVTIWGKDKKGNNVGHAVVAYKIEGNRIYVADPNFPGKTDRFLSFNKSTGSFDPYSSSLSAQDILNGNPIVFTDFCYIPVSTVMKWDVIGKEFENVLSGNIGDDNFPDKSEIEWLTKYDEGTGEEIWEKCPEELTLDATKTTQVNKALKGKIKLRLTKCTDNQDTSLYIGTNLDTSHIAPDNKGNTVIGPIALKKGVNDIGLLIAYKTGKDAKGNDIYSYSNFKRIKIIYNDVDLTGNWDIEVNPSSGSLLKFGRELIAQIAYQMKIYDTLDEARAEARSSVDVEPGGFISTSSAIKFEKNDKNNPRSYKITIKYTTDSTPYSVSCDTVLGSDGTLKFHFKDPQGQGEVYFTGSVQGNDVIGGDFRLDLYTVVVGVLDGTWAMTKKK